jgi:hypothetical protein
MADQPIDEVDTDLDDEGLPEEDLDEDALEDEDDLDELALDEDLEAGDDLDVDAVIAVPDVAVAATATATATEPKSDDEEDDVLDLDEELHPDDVEAPLDALLQERTAKATLEDEEEEIEEEEPDSDERGDGPTRIVPRRPGEFLCSSCFLVLPRNQLADKERMLCRDCA